MVKKRKNSFVCDLGFIGLLIFIVVNVWLSLVIKKLKNEAAEQEMHRMRERSAVFRLEHHIHTFRDVFCMNMVLHGAKLAEPVKSELRSLDKGHDVMLLLYLKANACSECNIHIINWLVKRNAGFDDFRILTHTSNAFYLEEMSHEGYITDASHIIWYDNDLYDGDLSASTADLVFVDGYGGIQALFPLDLIKDVCLFDEYLQCADKAFERQDRVALADE